MAVCDPDHVGDKFIREAGKGIWRSVLNFVFPSACLVCKKTLSDLPGVCSVCCAQLVRWEPERHRVDFLDKFTEVFILYNFNDSVRRLIHLLKYQGKTLPGKILGHAMGHHIRDRVDTDTLIVPVPLHSAKKRARGYNQSDVIAQAVGQVLGCQVLDKGLVRIKATQTQTKLGAAERQRNMSGAFKIKKAQSLQGQNVLLIDDVITTGATLLACVNVLMQAGAKHVSVAAVACPQLGDDATLGAIDAGA